MIHYVSMSKLRNHLDFDVSLFKTSVIIADLPLLHKDGVSKKEELIITKDSWALWWKVIYKAQISVNPYHVYKYSAHF